MFNDNKILIFRKIYYNRTKNILSAFYMINISTVVTAMQKELGSFVSTEAHPDMYRYINSAINYIYNRRDWGWNKQVYSFNYLSPLQEQTLPMYPQKVFSVKKD